ncbi:hypothetical protein MRB53_022482 [Persea americana]|uniref:Uncharacterized protein n=1 Tax=Persea americana TaxID=3435 RepID=A0ACC2L7Z4_PERAE|nr:hypothetical protein MRB53_022482 [Persea americana]
MLVTPHSKAERIESHYLLPFFKQHKRTTSTTSHSLHPPEALGVNHSGLEQTSPLVYFHSKLIVSGPFTYTMDVESKGGRDKNLRPHRRKVPRYNSNSKRMGGCCRCICCCCCFLLIFILIIVALTACLYTLYQPKIPSYKVEKLNITRFQVDESFDLNTELVITAKAQNPNEKISIIYGEKSSVSVSYRDSTLCSGKLPGFRQGHKNTRVMNLVLKGKSVFGSGPQEALMGNKKTGRIPLDISVKAPIVLDFGSLKTMEVKVLVDCHLIVNSLSPNEEIKILSSDYEVTAKM